MKKKHSILKSNWSYNSRSIKNLKMKKQRRKVKRISKRTNLKIKERGNISQKKRINMVTSSNQKQRKRKSKIKQIYFDQRSFLINLN